MASDFTRQFGLAHKLFTAAEIAGFTPTMWNTAAESPETLRSFYDVMNGEAKIVPIKISTPELDTIIRVDRSIRPTYPDFVEQEYVDTQEFIRIERTGSAEYSLDSLVLSLHPKQGQGRVATGHEVWEYQKKLGIEGCLSLADLLEIQKKGIVVFRKFFGGRTVFGWKSVVQNRGGYLDVPCLVGGGDRVVVGWGWLDSRWRGRRPALRFAS